MVEDIIEQLANWTDVPPTIDLRLDNILCGRSYYRKTQFDIPLADLSYYLCILGSGMAGFAYFNGNPLQGEQVLKLVDQSVIKLIQKVKDGPLRISLLDAGCAEFNKQRGITPDKVIAKRGPYELKANFRSKLITDRIKKGKKVALVGLVTEFIRDLLAKQCKVSICDLSPELRNKTVYDLPISTLGNGQTLKLIAAADYAIVSGATFSSNTIDSILDTAKQHNTDLYFYLETGSNFAPFLIEAGAKFVLAEKFPFYDLPGETLFEIYEA
jgi:hypothetical protein